MFRKYKINNVKKYDGRELKFDKTQNIAQSSAKEPQEELELKIKNKML